MSQDLFLRYKFTDRGGANVYDAYAANDNKRLTTKLFEIRISEDSVGCMTSEVTDMIEKHGTGVTK